MSAAATAGTLLCHPGLWGFSDSILAEGWLPCTVLSCCGDHEAWPVWSVNAPRGWELAELWWLVPECLSLCHSLKGSGLSWSVSPYSPLGCWQLWLPLSIPGRHFVQWGCR